MQNLFLETTYQNIGQRIEKLKPEAQRQWGLMDVSQMMAHCSGQLDMATGKVKRTDESDFVSRNIIRRVLPFINIIPKSTPTSNDLKVIDARDFKNEKQRLLSNLEAVYITGMKTTWFPHQKFGKLSGREWSHLIVIHLDHHLRQFSN